MLVTDNKSGLVDICVRVVHYFDIAGPVVYFIAQLLLFYVLKK